ncbi:MAG: GNAT family N-acetyltransferase [Alphaproteobacteria bacterium]|nr:GNAT family N-acetyltransferase [Alphaproteobacteria bacterium]
MSASKLVKPSMEYKESFLEALKEFHAEGRYKFIDATEVSGDFEGFVKRLNDGRRNLHKPFADWIEPVPETVLWFVKDDQYIGTFNIRHRLNWHLEKKRWAYQFRDPPVHAQQRLRQEIAAKGHAVYLLSGHRPRIDHAGPGE